MFGAFSGSDISGWWEANSGDSGTWSTGTGVGGAGGGGGGGGGGGSVACFIAALIN